MNKDDRYLFTIRSLTGGGAERVVSVLASNMAEDGYDVHIIAYVKSDHDYPVSKKVKLHYMPSGRKGLWGKIARIGDMKNIIDRIAPNVIIPFVGTVLFVSYFASRSNNIPLIRTIRNSPWIEEKRGVSRIMRKRLNRKAVAIMVQNEEQISYFPAELKKKIFVVPNPIDDIFLFTQKKKYSSVLKDFITVGRLEDQKNHELLIRAFAEINKRYSGVRLRIFGIGTEHDKIQDLIRALNLEESCLLMGRNDSIESSLKESDAFIMTSRYEGMPNALMEAMAIGLPCISSDCKTGPKTLINNRENGLLFSEGSYNDLVEKWVWLIENPDKAKLFGCNARQEISEKYTYKSIYGDLIAMLNKV